MKTHSLVTFTRGVMLGAIVCGCGADPSDDGEPYAVTTTELSAWADSIFIQTLRMAPFDATIANRCELTLRLQSAKPLTFIASQSLTGLATPSVGWTGSAISSSGLTVSGCSSYPCSVTATFLGTASNGGVAACQMIADDGASRIVGDSSGNRMAVESSPPASVMFKQHVQSTNSGTARTGTCILRQNGSIPSAQVSNFGVFVNGVQEVSLPGLTPVGNVAWPSDGPSVPFGRITVGAEATATRLKHVALRNDQLAEGDVVRCVGSFLGNGTGFSVNSGIVPSGGMSMTTEPTGWTCSPTAFGTGNGCDCDCGVIDPDCGGHDCFSVTAGGISFLIDGVNQPALNLVKGHTYVFDVDTGIHPFAIHSVPNNINQAFRYNDGVTGQGVTLGQLKFTPSLAAPATVYYQCEAHSFMFNAINLANP